jgi:mgtE-like transporter
MERRTFRKMLVAEIVSLTGGLVAGLLLAHIAGILETIPGMIILIPAFLAMRGNIGGCLAARLGSGLHLEVIRPFEFSDELWENLWSSAVLALITSLLIGGVAHLLSIAVGFETAGVRLILISIVGGTLANLIMLTAISLTTFWLFVRGHDPDVVMGPYVTTIGDVVSIFCLFIAAGVTG